MPLHHAGYVVSDLARSKEFYLAALAPLGYKVIKEFEGLAVGLGRSAYEADLWLSAGKSRDGGADKPPSTGLHVALKADSRAVVDQFHAAALQAGGKSNGGAGERDYAPNYYAAFIFDLDGNNIEVVHI